MSSPVDPPYLDTHRLRVAAPRDRVWPDLRSWLDHVLTTADGSLFTRLLGAEPSAGFAVTDEVPEESVELSGQHRFSRYRLVLETTDLPDGGTLLSALTYASFPGLHGRAYRLLVIGSRAHVLATVLMLRQVRRRATR